MNFQSVCIAGPGLLGGSLLLALRERWPGVRRAAWGRNEESLQDVCARSLADSAGTDLGAAVSGCDLVVLCVPVEAMSDLAVALKPALAPDALVTDVGSVKASVVVALEPILGAQFIGAHPMAGSEQTGSAAARADLFQGAPCLLTPTAFSRPAAVARIQEFWQSVGCETSRMTVAEHDAIVAWISHLPHVVAATLVNVITDNSPRALDFCGPGLRDSSRIAAGSAELWAGILEANAQPVRATLQGMIAKLQEVEKMLARPADLRAFLAAARHTRQGL